MVSPACIVVLCFALATLTFGAPNIDFTEETQGQINQIQQFYAEGNLAQANSPQGNPAQGNPPQGNPTHGIPPQGNSPQGNPAQGNSPQEYPPQRNPPQGKPPQEYPPQGNPPQGNPTQGYPPSENPPHENPPQGNPPQGNPAQGNLAQGGPGQGPPIRRIVYEFGTPTQYDVQISPNTPLTTPASPIPKDIKSNTKYTDLQNRKITYVKIEVDQNSDEGSVRIVEGAIGTDKINLEINALKTNFFRYFVKFYTSTIVQKVYTFGNTTQQLDELVRLQSSEQFSKDLNKKVILKYPGNFRKDQIITAVIISTKQTSDLGQASIIYGGLGKKEMEISLEVKNTKMLSYEAVFCTSIPSKPCMENNMPPGHNSLEFIYLKSSS